MAELLELRFAGISTAVDDISGEFPGVNFLQKWLLFGILGKTIIFPFPHFSSLPFFSFVALAYEQKRFFV